MFLGSRFIKPSSLGPSPLCRIDKRREGGRERGREERRSKEKRRKGEREIGGS